MLLVPIVNQRDLCFGAPVETRTFTRDAYARPRARRARGRAGVRVKR